mmetsp:Transcript_112754/g.299555  ORF Transcript_112754/g.299555 Transcript_112754/m.299555 type:complete len:89 (-) Transcript_112754:113-379(-)
MPAARQWALEALEALEALVCELEDYERSAENCEYHSTERFRDGEPGSDGDQRCKRGRLRTTLCAGRTSTGTFTSRPLRTRGPMSRSAG